MKICFIIGHGKSKSGGYDPGAMSGEYQEFKIAKEIGRYACEYFNENYTDICDIMNYNGDKYLTERIDAVNASDYDFIAEFHLNAGGGTGTECYYHVNGSEGKKYAEAISKAISDAFGIKNRGAKTKINATGKDYFAIIRETKPVAVLIETMFIDTDDLDHVKASSGQKKCGEAIARAIAKVSGATPKPKEEKSTLYRVQTGAFKNKDNAEALVEKLKSTGFKDAFIKSE